MEIGLINWFNDEKGFGVITRLDGISENNIHRASKKRSNYDYFFHISDWKDKIKFSSSKLYPILFKGGFERNRLTALECKYFDINETQHWETLMKYNNIRISIVLIILLEELSHTQNLLDILKDLLNKIPDRKFFDKDFFLYTIYNKTSNKLYKSFVKKIIEDRIINKDCQNLLNFLNNRYIDDFIIDKSSLISCYNVFSYENLKKISDEEIVNLIILKKINKLKENFNYTDFISFEELIKLIKAELFKIKIINDLNVIAKNSYLKRLSNKIDNILNQPTASCYDIKKIINNMPSFVKIDTKQQIIEILAKKIYEKGKFKLIIECWKDDIINELDEKIEKKLDSQPIENLLSFLNSKKITKKQTEQIFEILFNENKFDTLLSKAKYSEFDLFEKYDELVFNKLNNEEYFELWKENIGKHIPIDYLKKYIDHNEKKYKELRIWLWNKKLEIKDINQILLSKIEKSNNINDRFDFNRVYYSIKYLIEFNNNFIELLQPLKNDFTNLILWHFNKTDEFNLETLKGKFIYFSPDDQVYIFKRLFYLKHKGIINFTFEELDKIVRADLDLYLLNEKFNNDFVLDISTHIIIEAIKSYKETGNFLFESDLILIDLKNNSSKKFKIEKYFEECEGRMIAEWKWNEKNGEVIKETKTVNGAPVTYYKIEFEYNSNLVNEVRQLPNRYYNPNEKYWTVPAQYETEVLNFARKNNFFINIGDNQHYNNNTHLVRFERAEIPSGIRFCEGRKAKKRHETLNKDFWWCGNQPCYKPMQTDHLSEEFEISNKNKKIWEYYTLLDILNILEIDTDEINHMGDFIPKGHYYKFIGHINAFNRLLEKLYCNECGNLLYPKQAAHFALYRDVTFYCKNNSCDEYEKPVYLNHCFNSECNNIIDSRVSKNCQNGWHICDNCGSCCSHEILSKRLENLKLTGGYIHPKLIRQVKNKEGHLEKAEYYCYKCAGMMTQVDEKKYVCKKCNVTYDFEKFKWLDKKWTNIANRRPDYPVEL